MVLGSPSDSDQRMDVTSISPGVKSADTSHVDDGNGQHLELWDEPPTSLLPSDQLQINRAALTPDSASWVSPTEPSMYGL
jgi:hypothetical protein